MWEAVCNSRHPPRLPQLVVPAKAGTHFSATALAEAWIPAFADGFRRDDGEENGVALDAPLPRSGRGACGPPYSSPFFFKISSALLASIVSVGRVIFFSIVWPAISFRPWRTPSAPGVA